MATRGVDETIEFLEKLPRTALVGIMWSALEEMQAYNGRSVMECVLTALGAEMREHPEQPGRIQWKLPSVREATLRGVTRPIQG